MITQISKGSFVGYMWIAFETLSVDILLWLHLYTNCSGSLRKAALKWASTQILYCCHRPAAAAKGKGESKQLYTPHFSMSSSYLAATHWISHPAEHPESKVITRAKVSCPRTFNWYKKFNISAKGIFLFNYDKLGICDKLKSQWHSELLTAGHPDPSFCVRGSTGTYSKNKVTLTGDVSSTSYAAREYTWCLFPGSLPFISNLKGLKIRYQ